MEGEKNEVIVSAQNQPGLVAKIQAEGQTLIIDESGLATGVKAGPDPYDYIMGALGACTVITLHMYAKRKDWPLERAEVRLNHERVYADDCNNCENKDAKINQVTKKLFLYGPLTPEQRQRLEDISSRCPVQKTLEGSIQVKTILQE
jgi:putative redox protein